MFLLHAGRDDSLLQWRLVLWSRSPDETFQVVKPQNRNKQRFFVLVELVHPTPSVLQGALCRLSFKLDQTEVIHMCIMNKHKANDAQIHVLTNSTFCFSSFTQKNNESAHRVGNFRDLIQSQVPSFKSLVMQMTTSRSFSLWCTSSSSIIAYIYILFQPCQDEFLLCIY